MGHRAKILAMLLALASASAANAESDAVIGNGPLYAIGVVTPDVDEAAKQYQRVFGVVPQIFGGSPPNATPVGNATPDGGKSKIRMAGVFFPNFYIKLQQPVNEVGPFAPFLRKYGASIMNLQIKVSDAQAIRARLEQQGGRWVLGSAEDHWAYVDLKETLGAILEPINSQASFPVNLAPDAEHPLGAMPVTHISVAVGDLNTAAKAYGDLFGREIPETSSTRVLKPAGQVKSSEEVHLRVTRWVQGSIGIELVQSTSEATPWSEFVSKNGNGAFSIGFDVGNQMDEIIDDLRGKGGTLLYLSSDGTHAYIDFRSDLGLVVELDGD